MSAMSPPPRLELALAPTPILRLERLSRRLGVEFYVKRDDLTGLVEAGHMIRKLEFLAGEALGLGADTLITGGTIQSSGGRAVSAVAARLGLRAILAIEGERPDSYDGDVLLGRLLGAEIRWVDQGGSPLEEALEGIAAEVRGAGGRPYRIPENGASDVGALGYLECAVELAGQVSHGAPRFDTIVIAARSGTSQAGLLMGKQLTGLPSEIVGVPVVHTVEDVRRCVTATIERAIHRFGLALDLPKAIHLLDGYQGAPGHAADDEDLRAIVALARDEGLVLDPGSSIKAFRALVDTLGRDAHALGQRVCFMHTGAPFDLFPLRDRLTRCLDGQVAPRA